MADDSAPDLQGLKILVIDDSKTIRRTAETLLAKEGCTVFTAMDGFDALSKIADHNPDIIFVDIKFHGKVFDRWNLITMYKSTVEYFTFNTVIHLITLFK